MSTRKILTAATIALMSVVACNKEKPVEPTPETPEVLQMNFKASLYEFTKATDTAFENGDAIGVNVFNPEVYLYNAKYTYDNGSLTSATPNEWYEDTELEATITAVYPCSDTEEAYAADQTFIINADQSSKSGYSASDLMFAVTKSKPTAEAVSLPFKHALSKIVVTVDNKLGESISQVWFTDVKGEVTYKTNDPIQTLATTGTAGTVKAYKSGDNTWQLIIAPQTASPKLALTTASGKQFTFVLSENVTFTSGKVSTATVEVSSNSIYTSFTPEISDWTADNELNFSQDDDAEVEIPVTPTNSILYLNPREWNSDSARFEAYFYDENKSSKWVTMTDNDSDGIYECEKPSGFTMVVFCRMDPEKAEANWDSKWNQTVDLPLEDGKNLFTIEFWGDESTEGKSTGSWSTK